ncbi:MAG: lipocalin family protein [Chitinophagaceae bacterium]|jgi:hypothetical protein
MKKIILAILIGSVCFSACKKKEPSKTELLQNGKWKLTAANFSGFYDILANFKDCQKDNTYTFNSNKSITVDEGATKCNDTVAQSYTDGKWNLSGNDTKISLDGSSIMAGFAIGVLTADIVVLNATTLQISKDTAYTGFSGKASFTFTNVK